MNGWTDILWWVYVFVGPGVWVILAYLVMVGRQRMTRLKQSRAVLPSQIPLVSILIPARDEAGQIRACVERVTQQDYPFFEVVIINDRSQDQTGIILDQLAEKNPKLKVRHLSSLEPGWLGKCYALDQGTRQASGQWLFFVDSDVELQPEALSKLMAYALDRRIDALSILTRLKTHRLVEKLMLPLLAGTWACVFAADQTNEDSEPDRALANGQVFLIRTSAYQAVGGHGRVKDRIVEDVELMRALKREGFKTRFLAGRHLASTRMHTHLGQMFHGWARIFAGTSRGQVLPMLLTVLFLGVCLLSVYPALIYGWLTHNIWWWGMGLIHWVGMTGLMGLIWWWSGNSPVWALGLPVSVPIQILILLFSIQRAWKGVIEWRGMRIDLRAASRVIEAPNQSNGNWRASDKNVS